MKVLVIGQGGREHCLTWKIAQSPKVDKIYVAPGNAGTSLLAENLNIPATDIDNLLKFALKEKVDLTVVGPEAPLVSGIVDRFESEGLKTFGPRKEVALLEGSKVFAKELMKKYGIPTAEFEIFDDAHCAKEYIKEKGAPIVVKADGLAAGKGVIVCKTVPEALRAVDYIIVEKKFGSAGNRVVVEECLEGEEASILIFTDGDTIIPLVASQDHKPIFDGDSGPNTGGMGAYSPAPLVNDKLLAKIIDEVFNPLIKGLKEEGKIYKGMLYVGLMIKDNQFFVLEFNVRFGDPEIQAILPKVKSDLTDIMFKTIDRQLKGVKIEWDRRTCLCVVLASGGYPGSYEKGKEIKGLKTLENLKDIFVFHAGTKLAHSPQPKAQSFLTNGGRVLNVVGLGETIKDAQDKVYRAIEKVHFEKMHYRRDIGNKALQFLG